MEADASVAQLVFCTVTYCWRDISAHVSSLVYLGSCLGGMHADTAENDGLVAASTAGDSQTFMSI